MKKYTSVEYWKLFSSYSDKQKVVILYDALQRMKSNCKQTTLICIAFADGFLIDSQGLFYRPERNTISHIKNVKEMKKIALKSTVNPGLLCKDGVGNYVVSTEYLEGQRYDDLVKTFDSKEEAMEFIREKEFYALEPIEIDENYE